MILVIFLVFLFFTNSSQRCTTEVCFTWKVKVNELILSCRVSPLKFRVKILNPFNDTIADCTPPYPKKICDAYYRNSTIDQDLTTNITMFVVHGRIDKGVNGLWTCKHGTGLGTAFVEVTVLTIRENTLNGTARDHIKTTDEQVHDKSCWKDTVLIAVTCVIVSYIAINMIVFALVFLRKQKIIPFKDCCKLKPSNARNCYGICRFLTDVQKEEVRKVTLKLIAFGVLVIITVASYVTDNCKYNWIFGVCSCVIGLVLTILNMCKYIIIFGMDSNENSEESAQMPLDSTADTNV